MKKENSITASILAQLEETSVQNTVIDQNNASTPAAPQVAKAPQTDQQNDNQSQTDQQTDTRRPRMCMISSVQKNEVPTPLTPELLRQVMNNNKTVALQAQINDLDQKYPEQNDDYKKEYSGLKTRLSAGLFHCGGFDNDGVRSKDNLTFASGMASADFDHINNPRELFARLTKEQLINHHVALAFVTPSNRGLKIVFRRLPNETIEAAQLRMAALLGLDINNRKVVDTATKDPQRAAFIPSLSHLLHICNDEFYFANEEEQQAARTMYDPIDHGTTTKTTAVDSAANTVTSGNTYPETFIDNDFELKYKDVVDQLTIDFAKTLNPAMGQRHNTYLYVVKNIKYITDFDQSWMYSIIPSFDLSEKERLSILDNHSKKYGNGTYPANLVQALTRVKVKTTGTFDQLQPEAIPLPVLPDVLTDILHNVPDKYKRPMIIWTLPFLGALASGLRFKYRENTHSPSFMTLIYGEFAAGKSAFGKVADLLLTRIDEQDEQQRKIEREYKDKLRKARNKKDQEQLEDPHVFIRHHSPNMSLATIYEQLENSQYRDKGRKQDPLHLVAYTDELDSMIRSEGQGKWAEKKDIYKSSFANEQSGSSTITSGSKLVHIYYNWGALGTSGALMKFFTKNDSEGGLVSRIMFAAMPDDFGTEGFTLPDFTGLRRNRILEACDTLMSIESDRLYYAPIIDQLIKEWVEQKIQLAKETGSRAVHQLMKRSAVMGAKAAYIAAYLNGSALTDPKPVKKLLKKVEKDQTAAQFGLFIAEYVFQNQLIAFWDTIEQMAKAAKILPSQTAAMVLQGTKTLDLYDSLPQIFTKDQFTAQATLAGKEKDNQRAILCRWLGKQHRIIEIGEKTYQKI